MWAFVFNCLSVEIHIDKHFTYKIHFQFYTNLYTFPFLFSFHFFSLKWQMYIIFWCISCLDKIYSVLCFQCSLLNLELCLLVMQPLFYSLPFMCHVHWYYYVTSFICVNSWCRWKAFTVSQKTQSTRSTQSSLVFFCWKYFGLSSKIQHYVAVNSSMHTWFFYVNWQNQLLPDRSHFNVVCDDKMCWKYNYMKFCENLSDKCIRFSRLLAVILLDELQLTVTSIPVSF